MFLNRDFAWAMEIIQKSFLTLDSGKFVELIQTFGSLVSFFSSPEPKAHR